MFKNTKLLPSIELGLFALIMIVSLLYYPFGIIKVRTQHKALEKGMAVSGPIQEDLPFAGIFQPSHANLSSLGFRFFIPHSSENPGHLRFWLKDQQDTVIYEATVKISELTNNDYYDFTIPLKLNTGEPYIYQLNAYQYGDTAPCIYLGSPAVATIEHQAVYYNGQELLGNAPIAVYTYQAKASLEAALPYLIVLYSIGILLLVMIRNFAKSDNQPEESDL